MSVSKLHEAPRRIELTYPLLTRQSHRQQCLGAKRQIIYQRHLSGLMLHAPLGSNQTQQILEIRSPPLALMRVLSQGMGLNHRPRV